MANVTQLIPNYLGGVSRKADFDKEPGEVRDAVNAYPDDTYGMLKRPGTEFLGKLPVPEDFTTNWDEWSFFPLIREGRPRYLVGLQSGNMLIWNMDDLNAPITITLDDPTIYDYLDIESGTNILNRDMYRMVSDDRRSFILNRSKTVKGLTDKTGFDWAGTKIPGVDEYRVANSVGELPDSSVKEVLLLIFGDSTGTLREGWHILGTSHSDNNQDHKGYGLTVKCYINSSGNIDNSKEVTIVSAGYGYYNEEGVSVDGVPGSRLYLRTGLTVGEVYRIKQTNASDDDFYMMPLSNTSGGLGREGPFYWVEVSSPDATKGLDASTLPFQLLETDTNQFEVKITDYSYRWAGDNINNPDPSFVNHRINNVFLNNSRLGFLSEDNVILSRPVNYGPPGTDDDPPPIPDGNPFVRRDYTEIDFYHQSAIQQVADDPIDLNAASNDTSVFHKAISTPQGLVLFSDGQQSLMFSDDGILTPATANIRGISSYDVAPDIEPVMQGSIFYFANKTEKYCRLYVMQTQGLESPPVLQDLSKTVSDWLPNNITDLVSSRTTNQVVLFNRDSNYLYVLTNNDDIAAWTKWLLPAKPVQVIFDHTRIYTLMQKGDSLYLALSEMFLYPDVESLGDIDLSGTTKISPYLDFYCLPQAVNENVITPPTDFPRIDGLQPCYVVASQDLQALGDIPLLNSGEVGDLTFNVNGNLEAVDNLDLVQNKLVIGYRYNFELELPTFFFQQGENLPDYTAYLTISRLKFALALSGDANFQSKALGSDTWNDTFSQTAADYYVANSAALAGERITTVPIHQRNTNFQFKITSDTPFPLSVDSCMWEGIYSPRYYRRT